MAKRRFGLLSDTHGAVHPALFERLADVENILHAGDVGGEDVLAELRLLASTHAVCGNVDYPSADLPETRVVDLPFGRVGIAHGHRYPTDREARARALLDTFAPNDVRVILHGHSHLQLLDFRNGVWVVNPGSAGHPRFRTVASFCLLEWESDHDLLRFDFQPLSWS